MACFCLPNLIVFIFSGMVSMDKRILYRKAYRMLDDITPLKIDCGLLCKSRCCRGDSNMGMVMFPGEYGVFSEKQEFLRTRRENMNGSEVLFGTCTGRCDRKYRPLSCRIYPLVPVFDARGNLTVIMDPRARYTCPLVSGSLGLKISPMFKRRVCRIFKLLCGDSDIKKHISVLTSVIESYRKFTGD